MIYLDASALLKLLFEEPESAALAAWLAAKAPTPLVTSELARVEVLRACRRSDPAALPAARSLLDALDLVPLGGPVLADAAEVEGATLRSLDAIHLASARSIAAGLTAFVAYDHRLAEAATATGLDVHAPGT